MAKRETVLDEFESLMAHQDDVLEEDPNLDDFIAWQLARAATDWDLDVTKGRINAQMNEGVFYVSGTFGAWDGPRRVASFVDDVEDLFRTIAIRSDSFLVIETEGPHLYITQHHHDGTNYYELRRLSPKGLQRYAGWLDRCEDPRYMLGVILRNERTYSNAFGPLAV